MSELKIELNNQEARNDQADQDGWPHYLTLSTPNDVAIAVCSTTDRTYELEPGWELKIDCSAAGVDPKGVQSVDPGQWDVSAQGDWLLIKLPRKLTRELGPTPLEIELTNVICAMAEPGPCVLNVYTTESKDLPPQKSLPMPLTVRQKPLVGDKEISLRVQWEHDTSVPIGSKVTRSFTIGTHDGQPLPRGNDAALYVWFSDGTGASQLPAANVHLRRKRAYGGVSWEFDRLPSPATGWKLHVDKATRIDWGGVPCAVPDVGADLPPEVIQLNQGKLPEFIAKKLGDSDFDVSKYEKSTNEWTAQAGDETYILKYDHGDDKHLIDIDHSEELLFRQHPYNKVECEITFQLPRETQPGVVDLTIEWVRIPGYLAGSTELAVTKDPIPVVSVEIVDADGKTPASAVVEQPGEPFTYMVDVTEGSKDMCFKFIVEEEAAEHIHGIAVGDSSDLTLANRPTEEVFAIDIGSGGDNGDDARRKGWRNWSFHAVRGSRDIQSDVLRFKPVRFQPPYDDGDLELSKTEDGGQQGFDLPNYDFMTGRSLKGADLTRTNLVGAKLGGVDLSGAVLAHADLSDAFLKGADLRLTNLRDALNLDEARDVPPKVLKTWRVVNHGWKEAGLDTADFRGEWGRRRAGSHKDFSQCCLKDADLRHADLSGVDLTGADLTGAHLDHANFRRAIIDGDTQLDDKWRLVYVIVNKNTDYESLPDGVDLSNSNLRDVDFDEANLKGAVLSHADLTGAKLRFCDLSDADLRHADLHNATFEPKSLLNAQLGWNDWTGTHITRAWDPSTIDMSKWAWIQQLMNGDVDLPFEQNADRRDLRDAWLVGLDLQGGFLYADFAGSDLTGANLSNTYLWKANFKDAVLRGANLEGALLTDADLTGANLELANLRGINFEIKEPKLDDKWLLVWQVLQGRKEGLGGKDLSHAYLENVDLKGADLVDTCLTGSDLRGANLRDADLRGADLRGADLRGANLHGSKIDGTQLSRKWQLKWHVVNDLASGNDILRGSDLSSLDLQNAHLEGATLDGTDFRSCDLRGANLKGASLKRARLQYANLHNADLRNADLSQAQLDSTEMSGADLSYASVAHADLSTVGLRSAKLDYVDLQAAKSYPGLPHVDGKWSVVVQILKGEPVTALDFWRDLSNADLHGRDLTGVTLRFVNLKGANLCGANLTGVDLKGADFAGALVDDATKISPEWKESWLRESKNGKTELRKAPDYRIVSQIEFHEDGKAIDAEGEDFSHSDLSDADFSGANLRKADFRYSNLSRADFSNAQLWAAKFDNANLTEATLTQATLDAADLPNATLRKVSAEWSSWRNANLKGADLSDGNFAFGSMVMTDLSGAKMRGAVLPNYMTSAILMGVDLRNATNFQDLYYAKLRGVDLRKVNLRGATLESADLTGADLRGADLTDARLNGKDPYDPRPHPIKKSTYTRLTDVKYDKDTKWPRGFSVTDAGLYHWGEHVQRGETDQDHEARAKTIIARLPLLRRGGRQPEVERLQQLLNSAGASLRVDGEFGSLTAQAVQVFQRGRNLAVDGVVGKYTWGALFAADR